MNTRKARKKKSKRLLVGITGGMGAGKSAVAEILRQKGYAVLSADSIAREITASGSAALEEIHKLFGEESLHPDGSLNRAWVRSRIAQDSGLRAQLERITHPRIQERARALSAAAFAQGAEIVFYEAPLLYEAKSDRAMDKVICVHAGDELRIRRVMERDRCPRDEAERLLASQLPQEEKMRRADFLIANEGDLAALSAATDSVLAQL